MPSNTQNFKLIFATITVSDTSQIMSRLCDGLEHDIHVDKINNWVVDSWLPGKRNKNELEKLNIIGVDFVNDKFVSQIVQLNKLYEFYL